MPNNNGRSRKYPIIIPPALPPEAAVGSNNFLL